MTSIQIHWNSEWYGGFDKLLKCENIDHTSEEFNYSEVLKLNENDLLALKSSSLEFCIKKYLQDIQNGTSHSAIADSIHKLSMYTVYISIKHTLNVLFQICKYLFHCKRI